MEKKLNIPELLAPAGSPLALRAAIEGGADAVYMGGVAFNARINAKNFTEAELREGIELAHSYGVKIYIAANTLIYDREREDYLRAAEQVYLAGADALIVADVGMAAELKKRIPIELHGSTQLSGHNVDAARLLAENGFSRMVCAREMSREDLAAFCAGSPIESEVFVHGALCVSTSGQCLFSSIVGGRSGNRGECAQPCRLPYTVKGKQAYPLSLKDLTLCEHITELCDMGVSSFKIEGRMKAPEYVRDVISIWRRLLDERRNAGRHELLELERIFSRGGFTDGYYVKNIGKNMLGVRSEADKSRSAQLTPFENITKKIDIDLKAKIIRNAPAELCASANGKSVTVYGNVPEDALTAPLSREVVERNLSKLGGTVYALRSLDVELEDGLMMPISALNALRRSAIEALMPKNMAKAELLTRSRLETPDKNRTHRRTAVFYDSKNIPDEAWDFFDKIFVPLEVYDDCPKPKVGVMLPEVIFDSQREQVKDMLTAAAENGATDVMIGNIGHLDLAKSSGLNIYGDLRLNVANPSTVSAMQSLGIDSVIASPELTLAQLRDLGGDTGAVIYGRLPLMITEKCIGKELGGCQECESGRLTLTDRKGVSFPVLKRYGHRSVIFNSVPIYMADRKADLERYRISNQHYIFTTETKKQAAQVIRAYQTGAAVDSAVKRLR